MNGSDWVVLLGGAATILWVNWYFFVAGRSITVAASATASATPTSHLAAGTNVLAAAGPDVPPTTGGQEATVIVKGGYEPSAIRVRSGVPVRITFDRQETSSCSEEIVFPDFDIKRFLPPFKQTVIEVTPDHPGTYGFTCGMGMLRGRLIAD